MRNVLDKRCRDNQNTYLIFDHFFENRAVCEVMSGPAGPQMTSHRDTYQMHAESSRLPARTRTHTPTRPGTCTHERPHTNKYVIFIAFPRIKLSLTRLSVTLNVRCLSCLYQCRKHTSLENS